jgi:L-amino acid N-acyltransferase
MQQNIFIRDMTEADLPAVLDIYNDVIINTTAVYSEKPHTLEMRRSWFNERGNSGFPLLVMEDNESIIGFGSYGYFRAWPCYRFTAEHSLYVHKDYRSRGLSKILLAEIIERAKAAKLHVLIAGIDSDNTASLHLHELFGFVQVAHFKEVGFKFNRWLDLIFLELKLE